MNKEGVEQKEMKSKCIEQRRVLLVVMICKSFILSLLRAFYFSSSPRDVVNTQKATAANPPPSYTNIHSFFVLPFLAYCPFRSFLFS